MKYFPHFLVLFLCGSGLTLMVVGIKSQVKVPAKKAPIEPEYILEIINQDSVAVYSNSTHRLYKVRFDLVETVLIKDNL